MDYAMSPAENFPQFGTELPEIPAKTNPLGVKGIGEAGCVASPPAVMNAPLDTLAPLDLGRRAISNARIGDSHELARAAAPASMPEQILLGR